MTVAAACGAECVGLRTVAPRSRGPCVEWAGRLPQRQEAEAGPIVFGRAFSARTAQPVPPAEKSAVLPKGQMWETRKPEAAA